MALQYFLYNTNFGNTIVDRSNTSFTPITPYEEIYIDFFIPETQPLYLYANSGGTGGTIIVNSQENIDNYLDSIIPAPTADSNVTYGEFSGATAVLENYTGNGIVSGFVVSRNELDSGLTSINISSGIGYIIDNYTNPEKPIRTKLEFSGQTGITIQYIASGLTTYIAIDSGSTIIQKQTEFTPDERRDYIILGIVIHTNLTIINTVNNLPDVILDSHSQMNDFFDAFKNFNVDGNIISANGANLKINKSAGHIFKRGVNFNIDNKNPHIITLPESIAPFTIRYRLSDGTEYSNTDSVSLYYENPLGTRIALPSTGYSVQRIIIFPSNLIRIQYGQGVYDTMGLAVSSIYAEDFVYETNIKENGLLRGYLVVKGGITSLLNTDDVKFIEADRFGSMPKGAGSVALGLQDVTETQSNTNVETTFENGLVLDKLRPSEDSISAITINKNDGTTPVIIIDTVSGLTGFGVQPQNKIHTYGLDDSDDDLNSTHKNGITIDGVIGGDKDVIWADNGQNKWYGEIYRHEEGRFWYLYSEEGDISPITVSESGRIGLNSTTNIIDYQPVKIKGLYSGISTNNVFFGGLYNKNFISIYQLEINDSVTIPNTFRWRKSVDDGSTYDDWSDSTGCTTGATIIDSGVEVSFIDVSGFTSGDTWQITAFPQLSPATLSLVANRLNRVFVTYNYTAATPTYFDLSTTVNTTEIEAGFAFPTGTTNTAAFAGGNTKINSIFVNVIQGGLGMTAVVEYWNGSGWVDITVGSDYFVDGTENLTKTGTLSWNISTMTDWEKYDLNNSGDEFYWLRVRTASAPTISPILGGMSRGGNNRFSVYSSAFDTKPSFTIDALGRTSIGGGNIVGKNILQVGNVLSVHESQFESMAQFDSDDSTSAALRLRLSYEGDKGFCLGFGKNRGTAENPAPVQTGDEIGSILWGAAVDDIETGILLGDITTYYTGDNVSRYGDMVFKTHDNSVSPFPTEVMRISGSGNTGFGGITIPTAKIHIQSGSTSVAPFKFNSGQLLTSPQIGAIEFNGTQWYGTVSGDTRKTFAFLESPVFTGTPVIPITTMFDGTNLVDYITNSGGTNNTLLISTTKFNTYTGNTNTRLEDIESDIITVSATTDSKLPTATFNAYTGGTIAWDKVNKTGSDLADLETRNAVDVNYTEPHWGINNVDEALNEVLHYTENFGITGRIEPIDVLFGTRTNTLIVSGGTGYINYEGFHKKITWTGRTFDISGSTTEGVYFVYVNSNSEVNISTSQPNVFENISLGTYYFGGYIGVIQQSGIITTSSSNRVVDSLIRQGIFIYDNGGLIQLLSGSTTKIISPPCKIQYGLIPSNLNEISSNDASTYQFLHYYDSADYKWSLNYHFSVMNQGKIYTNRWNDITKNQVELLTGHTLIFTQYSNIVTSTSDLTLLDLENSFIYVSGDTDVYATPVSGVTWDGSGTTITLETMYVGAGGSGTTVANYTLRKLASDKYAKHLIIRSNDNSMFLVLGQTTYDSLDAAQNGVLPAMPTGLVDYAIKMAYIINVGEATTLADSIFDIRPLPYSFREGGQSGGGTTITSHGSLTGLAADDHLQYLRTDGSRNITGIQRYQSQPTFSTDLDIISRKYVNDADNLKLNITTFNTYSGTTIPNTYYNKTEINNYTGTTQAIFSDTLEPTGFINIENIIETYDSVTRTITLSAITGNVEYYWRGIKYNLGSSWTSTAHANTIAQWFLYSTDGINITWSNSIWEFNDLQVAFRPANSNWALRETHGTMQYSVHKELHEVVGTYKSSGFGLTNGTYSVQPVSPTDADNTPGFDSGVISDEDIQTSLSSWTQGSYTQLYFAGTGLPIFITGQTNLFRIGTTYPTYNSWNGSTFTDVQMSENYYGNWYVVRIPVTSDSTSQKYRAVILQPQYQYSTLGAAESENPLKLNLEGLADFSTEFVLVERITLRTNSTYSGATNNVRIESYGMLNTTRFGQVGSGNLTINAENVAVNPTSPFTAVNMQNLSDEFAIAINERFKITDFNSFTGTTLPANYYNKTQINTYTGLTATAIGLKANIASPTFTGIPAAPTAAVNTSTTQIATTAYVVGQAANVNPLMDGTVAIGTSLRYARQDHIHASDTSRVAKAGDTMTGALTINSNLTVTGNTNISGNTRINGITRLGNVTPDVNQQNFSVIDVTTKKVADSGTKFHVYGTEFYYAQELTTTTTTVVTPTFTTKLTINTATVPAGTYRVTGSYGMNKGVTNSDMLSRIQVDGTSLGDVQNHELGDAATWIYTTRVMFITFATAATHTITLQFSQESSGTLSMDDASLEFVRVS